VGCSCRTGVQSLYGDKKTSVVKAAVAPFSSIQVKCFFDFDRSELGHFRIFDVETLSHGTARRHSDAVDVVLAGASSRLTAARSTAWYRRGGCRCAP
jgi:hypothetical protein